jgi:hypothetical protein
MIRTTRPFLLLSALAGVCTAPVVACGGSTPKPASAPENAEPTSALENPNATAASAPATAGTSAEPAGGATSAATEPEPPLAQVLTTDSAQIQKIFEAASSSPAATLKANGAKGGDPMAKGIRDAAMKLPPGMQPDGPLAMGSLKEKQHLHTDVTLQPGKCYSIVGFSPKVKDLDLYLLLPPGILSGQDLTDDNKPIIGGPPQPMCPISAQPVTYKVDIYAERGAGDVVVQLFSKGK